MQALTFERIDRCCDYVPVLSTFSNLTYLFLKCVTPCMPEAVTKSRCWVYIQNKDLLRSAIASIFVLGNLCCLVADILSFFYEVKRLEKLVEQSQQAEATAQTELRQCRLGASETLREAQRLQQETASVLLEVRAFQEQAARAREASERARLEIMQEARIAQDQAIKAHENARKDRQQAIESLAQSVQLSEIAVRALQEKNEALASSFVWQFIAELQSRKFTDAPLKNKFCR